MAEKLPPRIVRTPAETSVVTATVRKSWWGRALDLFLILCAFLAALLASVGDIDLASLGFSPKQAAWIGMGIFILRFALSYRPVTLVAVKAEPVDGGQG